MKSKKYAIAYKHKPNKADAAEESAVSAALSKHFSKMIKNKARANVFGSAKASDHMYSDMNVKNGTIFLNSPKSSEEWGQKAKTPQSVAESIKKYKRRAAKS